MKKRIFLTTALFLGSANGVFASQAEITQIPALGSSASIKDLREAINHRLAAAQPNFTEIYTALNGSPWLVQTTAPNVHNVFWIDTSGASPAIKYWDGDSWEVAASGGDGTYTLPTASTETKGGVKIGARLTMTGEVLSADVQTTDISGKENSLGNPSTNGYVLSSTTEGIRSWVEMTGAGTGIAHATSDGNYYASRNGEWANLAGVFLTPTGSAAGLTNFPTLNQNTTGTAATVTGATQSAITSAANLGTVGTITSGTWSGAPIDVAHGGSGRATGSTAYSLLATGTTATGAQQTLASGATTTILVGGGSSALPVWTTATGSGAPVRATSPTLVTPALGTPSGGNLANCTFPTLNQNTTGTAAGLTAQYINWGSASGGSSIANKPTLGTASALNVGTAAGNVVQLDSSGALPAVSAANLTNLPSASLPAWLPSTGPTADNQIIQATAAGSSSWTDVFDGLINDAGTGTDDLWSAAKNIAMLSGKQATLGANAYQTYDANMIPWPSAISATEVGYLDGLSGAISTSLSSKLNTSQLDDTKGNGDTGYIWSADKVFDLLALKAPLSGAALVSPSIQAKEVNGSATTTLTAEQVSGTVIYNTGMGATDVALGLPTAAFGLNGLFDVGTSQNFKWGVRAGTSDKIYLINADGTISAGVDNGYARMTNAQIGQSFACWTFKTDAYDWKCKAVSIGTSTFAAN